MNNIHKALAEIQKNLKAPKSQFNEFGKYKYRNLEDICAAVKPLASELGCIFTLSDKVVLIGERYYIEATALLSNGEGQGISVKGYAREAASKKGMDDSQLTGSCSSYARKYAANGLFAIDDTKDADSMNNSDTPKQKKQQVPDFMPPDQVKKYSGNFKQMADRATTIEALNGVWKDNEAIINHMPIENVEVLKEHFRKRKAVLNKPEEVTA